MVDEIKRTQPRLVRDRESLDYLHQESALAKRELNAYQAYCRMTENSSWLMRSAVWLRDALCKPFGVEQIGGFRNKSADAPPKVGEKLDFFLVEDISDRRLVLTVRDRHLDVMLSLTADPVAEGVGPWSARRPPSLPTISLAVSIWCLSPRPIMSS